MKPLLYIGLVLMVTASIYGFVDYKKASRSREFNSLYHEKELTPAKTNVNTAKDPTLSTPKKEIEKKDTVTNEPSKKINKIEMKTLRPPKKLNYKSFSRAPLREPPPVIIDTTINR